MRFDLFYELAVPDFAGRSEPQVFRETLEELVLAEHAGIHTAWFVEHHFMREYSHCSAPDLVLAAAAQRTRSLRLGQAVVPLPYHHPLQVAERLATLDLLSGGRMEFGFGRGFAPREYAAFGVPMEQSRSRTEEALAVIRQSLAGRPVNFRGRHFHIEKVEVLPRPVQQPHPPLWMAAVSPESFDLAARLGVGVLAGPFKPWYMVRADIERYRTAWRAHRRTGGEPARAGMTIGLLCLEDGRRARELARRHLLWFYRQLLKQTSPVLERLHAGYEHYRRLGALRFLAQAALSLTALEAAGMVVVGDPAHCRERLQSYCDAGVDRLLLAVSAGGLPTDAVRECLRLIGQHLIPHFADRTAPT
jgi:alkanesulfonate monooxygenase SsuD/methylene tetrahydromethanopterin reductase-like flavin-dependent oxidoreductase (luciferase family)